ncbi:MAG TPA: hypothetical protein VHZ50_15515, partial [Puia sp.]|nr:hypothetical protein [Puia sp.]
MLLELRRDISVKNYSLVTLIGAVLIATICFDDPHLYYYKRVIYVIFLYFSLYQLATFYFNRKEKMKQVAMPSFYKTYIYIFVSFIFLNLIVDCFNPAFSIITLLNHPYGVMAVVPVFAFKVGYQTTDTDKIFNLLFYMSIGFLIFIVFPIKGNNIYNAAMACYASVLPLFVFSLVKKKYRIYSVILLGLGFLLSEVSDSRTIVLRIILFTGLFILL